MSGPGPGARGAAVRPARRVGDHLLAGLLALPDRLPVLVLCLGVAGVLAVLVDQFRPVVVLPLALLGAVATWRLVPPAPPRTAAHLAALAAVLALCAGWLVVSLRYVSAYVVVNRDPGFLTLRGLWLSEHPTGTIPVGSAEAVGAAVPAVSAGTEAFWLQDGSLHVQGNAMLPTLLGMQGWVGGERAVLAGGLLIGVVALLAVFAAARAFAGPLWALVPVTALALSLPFLTVTRAAYTEPLTVVFLCGGLALLRGAWGAGGGVGRHLMVGLLTGAVAAARIDGAVVVVGLAVGYALVAASPLGRADRRAAVRRALAAIGGATAMLVLGMVDVLRLSPEYVRVHESQLTALLTATAAVVVLAVVVVLASAVLRRGLTGARRAVHRHRRVLGGAAAVVVLLVAVLLISRPLWWQGHHTEADTGYGYAVQVLQQAAGQPLDATRSYDEQTVTWVSWYLGWPAVLLGFAGLALLARRAVAGRDPARTVLVAVVAVAAVFPLVRVSITPDQIWAVRRLVPATFPGLLVAGACALAALAGRWGARARVRGGRSGGPGSRHGRGPTAPAPVLRTAAAVGIGTAVALTPVLTWGSVAGVVELRGRDVQAHAVCDALADAGVQRVVWVHSSPFRYLATLRVICDVEVVETLTPPSVTDLAAVAAAWGEGPVAVASFDPADLPWATAPTESVGGVLSTTLGRTLTGPPTTIDETWSEVWIGLLGADGTVTPLVGAGSVAGG